MKTKTITVLADPGHSWGKVSKKELIKLGIADKISPYSYQNTLFAYLEEDSDLSTYCNALKEKGIEFKFKTKHTNKRSRVRTYDSYRLD